jgi:hypothetical protein
MEGRINDEVRGKSLLNPCVHLRVDGFSVQSIVSKVFNS